MDYNMQMTILNHTSVEHNKEPKIMEGCQRNSSGQTKLGMNTCRPPFHVHAYFNSLLGFKNSTLLVATNQYFL